MDKIKIKKISEINTRRSKVLIDIDEHLEKVGNQFGSSFMDELYRRLKLVIIHFKLEFEDAMKKSIDKHNTIEDNLSLLTGRARFNLDNEKESERVPSFISDHEKVKKKTFAS